MNQEKPQISLLKDGDYSSGKLLTLQDGEVLSEKNTVAAVLSLFFQWPEYSECVMYESSNRKEKHQCLLDYDRDEAFPTELRITFSDKNRKWLESGAQLLLVLSLFKVQYEFTTEVIAISKDPQFDGWDAIVHAPASLTVIRLKELPRVSVITPLTVQFEGTQSKSTSLMQILQVGLTSMLVSNPAEETTEFDGFLRFNDFYLKAKLERISHSELKLSYQFDDVETYGKFFDWYRKFAFPSLVNRYDFSVMTAIELYSKTTYFSSYEGEKTAKEKEEIAQTWEDIKSGVHRTTADYYVTDKAGIPTGVSSLALCNFNGKEKVWAFHQLGAMKKPDLIDESSYLYLWRAYYLHARPEELSVSACFTSKSRWIERLYIKHATYSHYGTRLFPAKYIRCLFTSTKTNSRYKLARYKVGSRERITTTENGIWGAINPRFLNANQNLDTIVAMFERLPEERIVELGNALVSEANLEKAEILVTLPSDYETKTISGRAQKSDRFCHIPKQDLLSFISSIEHSIAVTKRKLQSGKAD